VTSTKWEFAPELDITDVKHQAQPDQLLPTSPVATKPDDRPISAPLPAKRKPGRPKGTKNGPNTGKNGRPRKSRVMDSLSTNEVRLCVLLMLTPKRCLATTAGTQVTTAGKCVYFHMLNSCNSSLFQSRFSRLHSPSTNKAKIQSQMANTGSVCW